MRPCPFCGAVLTQKLRDWYCHICKIIFCGKREAPDVGKGGDV